MAETVMQINMFEDRIKGSYSNLGTLKEKLKTKNQMFKDAFENDAEYAQLLQKEKEFKRQKASIKNRIARLPGVVSLKQEIDELKDEVKDEQYTLSAYLDKYATDTNATTIEINKEVLTIVKTVKLSKRK